MQTINIDGVTYEILRESPVMAKGYEGRTTVYLRRPKGTIFYVAVRYENGRYSTATSMGGWGRASDIRPMTDKQNNEFAKETAAKFPPV